MTHSNADLDMKGYQEQVCAHILHGLDKTVSSLMKKCMLRITFY